MIRLGDIFFTTRGEVEAWLLLVHWNYISYMERRVLKLSKRRLSSTLATVINSPVAHSIVITMQRTKLKFNKKSALSLALVSIGTLLCLTPALKATASAPNCPSRNSRPLYYAESANYEVSICSAENNQNRPRYYVAAAKNGSGGITLPLASYENVIFRARNGRYTYTLNGTNGQLIVQLPNGRRSVERLVSYGPLNHSGH
jgi:hypothetical protein